MPVLLGMNGPYEFTEENIDNLVTRVSEVNYALGEMEGIAFIVRYIGRAEEGKCKEIIKEHLAQQAGYTTFKFSYSISPKTSFEQHCRNYHDFGASEKLDNSQHPARPAEVDWKCPICNIFD